ncbi:hypothetical protein K7432_007728 [Basidiobolus ranarum]|uniref:Uncharacterized protein n=1 Tax=Basidiobolus ranarum TaxID=34480 RepID=A0ABR2WT19_9FUNG
MNRSRLLILLCIHGLLLCIAFIVQKSANPSVTETITSTESHKKFVEDGEPTEFQRIPLKTLIQQYPKDTNYFLYNWLSFLGFNNIRYMIEHAYYYGYLINRTVILPHRVHCRSCLHEGYCRVLGRPVDDSQLVDSPNGKEGKHRWSLPIEEFIDMNRMVEKSGGTMIRMQDFLRLQLYYQDLDRKGNTDQRNLIQYWDAIDPIEYLRDQRGITFEDGSASNFTVAFPSLSYVGTDRVHTICGQENSVDDLSPILAKEKKLRQAGQTSIDLYGYPDEPNYSVREFTTKTISLDDIPNLMGFAQEFGTNKYPQQLLHFTGRYIHWFPRRQFHFATEENRNNGRASLQQSRTPTGC